VHQESKLFVSLATEQENHHMLASLRLKKQTEFFSVYKSWIRDTKYKCFTKVINPVSDAQTGTESNLPAGFTGKKIYFNEREIIWF